MSVKELKAKAKELGLKGYSNLNKEELERMVGNKQAELAAEDKRKEDERIAQNLAAQAKSGKTSVADKSNKGGNMNKKQKQVHVDADAQLKQEMAKLDGVTISAEVANPAADEVMDEIKAEVRKFPKVVYRYVPTVMEEIDGFRINPVSINGEISCKITSAKFKIATGNAWYTAVKEGRVKAFILEFYGDTDAKKAIVRSAVRKIATNAKEKRGMVEYLFGKTADQSKSVFFAATRKELINIIGADPSVKKPVNKIGMPTFSNNIMEFVSSDIKELKLVVVDPRLLNHGRNYADGACYIDGVKFYYEEYINKKDRDAGKKPKLMVMDEGQIRMSGWEDANGKKVALPVVKGDGWLPTFFGYAEDFCVANGLKLGDAHGAIDIESLKSNPNGLKHGDILTVQIESVKYANKVSEETQNRVGTQLQCCDPVFAQAILEEKREAIGKDKFGNLLEPGIEEKGKIFKDFLRFDAMAVARVIRATASMEDSPLQEIKALAFAIPKDEKGNYAPENPNAKFYSAAYQTQYNQLSARGWAFYTNDVVRARVSNVGAHFIPHPAGLLDALEQKIYDTYGESVFLCIPPNKKEFIEGYAAHKFLSGGRAPFVGPSSIAEVLPLRKDENGEYILDPKKLRAKEGTLVTTTKSGFMVSSLGIKDKDGKWMTSCIESFNGDFDGDGAVIILSNVAAAPVHRIAKEMPGVEGEKGKPMPLEDDEFLDALIEAYNSQIESQKAIGVMDNFRKLLYAQRRLMAGKMVKINGVDRKCVPIPAGIGHIIAQICEEMIQSKKHVITGAVVNLKKAELMKKYAPDGVLPTGDDRPLQYLLLHNTLGLTETDEQVVNHDVLLNTLCNIVNEYNRRGIHEMDCYGKLWKALNGAEINMIHDDSEYWRNQFVNLWDKIHTLFYKPGAETPTRISEKTLGMCVTMGDWINGKGSFDPKVHKVEVEVADKDGFITYTEKDENNQVVTKRRPKLDYTKNAAAFPGYRYLSKVYLALKDKDQREKKFSELYEMLATFIQNWLTNTCGEDKERRAVVLRVLGIYMGTIGFGTGVSRDDGTPYSWAGHGFWALGGWKEGKEALHWIAKCAHPNNPFLKSVHVEGLK